MALQLKGSRTEKNLAAAFAGKSMARNRYTYFASVAKKQGFEQISAIFLETAGNEIELAKRFLEFMESDGTPVPIRTTVPAVTIGSTIDNLKGAADQEKEECEVVYKRAAEIAQQEGFDDISRIFTTIAEVGKEHERTFRILAKQVESGTVFKRNRLVRWKCRNCGFIIENNEAPNECPACGHPQGFYQIQEVLE